MSWWALRAQACFQSCRFSRFGSGIFALSSFEFASFPSTAIAVLSCCWVSVSSLTRSSFLISIMFGGLSVCSGVPGTWTVRYQRRKVLLSKLY